MRSPYRPVCTWEQLARATGRAGQGFTTPAGGTGQRLRLDDGRGSARRSRSGLRRGAEAVGDHGEPRAEVPAAEGVSHGGLPGRSGGRADRRARAGRSARRAGSLRGRVGRDRGGLGADPGMRAAPRRCSGTGRGPPPLPRTGVVTPVVHRTGRSLAGVIPMDNHRKGDQRRDHQHRGRGAEPGPGVRGGKELVYLPGFGNEHSSEAVPGALPAGRNSPQRAPWGCTRSSSAAPPSPSRAHNRRSWLYRIRPSAAHRRSAASPTALPARRAVRRASTPTPNRLRWDPLPLPEAPTDFVDGLRPSAATATRGRAAGMAIHVYAANRSMDDGCFYDADGELLIVPAAGRGCCCDRAGRPRVEPGEIARHPARHALPGRAAGRAARGYVCENYGAALRACPTSARSAPTAWPTPRDFLAPVAAYEDREGPVRGGRQVLAATCGRAETTTRRSTSSPGTATTCRTNTTCARFNVDRHRAASTIPTRRSSPCSRRRRTPRAANVDFVVFPPRWLVGRGHLPPAVVPPQRDERVHGADRRRVRRQGRGLRAGRRLACTTACRAHGPDRETFERGERGRAEAAEGWTTTLAFMFETRWPVTADPAGAGRGASAAALRRRVAGLQRTSAP